MARTGLLNDRDIRNAKPEAGKKVARLLDGDRLYLFASTAANEIDINRTFVFRYQLDEVRHDYGIGPYPTVSLAEARRRAAELRLKILDGIDPMQERKDRQAERKAKLAAETKRMTFAQCAEQYIRIHAKDWKAPKHRKIWESTLRTYALPTLGKLDVADVETAHIEKLLTPIWDKVPVTAKRVRNRIELVLNFATAGGFRKGENPATNALLKSRLGKSNHNGKHHDALPYIEAPAFVAELRKRDLVSARALEFAILTAARTDEALGAVWSEFDMAKKLWVVPAQRMKAGKEHRVPLSDRVIEILKSLPRHGDHVFMNGKTRFHKNTLHKLLKKMRPHATVHGFRSTFSTWAHERTNYPHSLANFCLAHAVGDATERAYQRGDGLQKRIRLMQTWADFLAKPHPATAQTLDLQAERQRRSAS